MSPSPLVLTMETHVRLKNGGGNRPATRKLFCARVARGFEHVACRSLRAPAPRLRTAPAFQACFSLSRKGPSFAPQPKSSADTNTPHTNRVDPIHTFCLGLRRTCQTKRARRDRGRAGAWCTRHLCCQRDVQRQEAVRFLLTRRPRTASQCRHARDSAAPTFQVREGAWRGHALRAPLEALAPGPSAARTCAGCGTSS